MTVSSLTYLNVIAGRNTSDKVQSNSKYIKLTCSEENLNYAVIYTADKNQIKNSMTRINCLRNL